MVVPGTMFLPPPLPQRTSPTAIVPLLTAVMVKTFSGAPENDPTATKDEVAGQLAVLLATPCDVFANGHHTLPALMPHSAAHWPPTPVLLFRFAVRNRLAPPIVIPGANAENAPPDLMLSTVRTPLTRWAPITVVPAGLPPIVFITKTSLEMSEL